MIHFSNFELKFLIMNLLKDEFVKLNTSDEEINILVNSIREKYEQEVKRIVGYTTSGHYSDGSARSLSDYSLPKEEE